MRPGRRSAPTTPPAAPNPALAAAIAALVFLIFSPSLRGAFLNWDDNFYVYENEPLLRGASLAWTLAAGRTILWHPLTLLSLALDHAVWGLNPFGYHLTNVLFHSLNAALVFWLALKIFQLAFTRPEVERVPSAALAAAAAALFFALHPLRVESVSWVSERKDVLCLFFALLSANAYMDYGARGGKLRYALALTFFAAALAAKPLAVTLPAIFLILDYYPLRRERASGSWREKIPFFALSALIAGAAVWAQKKGEVLVPIDHLPWSARLAAAPRALMFYIGKILWPAHLAPFYPWPARQALFDWRLPAALALIALVTAACLRAREKNRVWLAAWLCFVAPLLPVLNLLQYGMHFAADRNTYLPSLAPALLFGAGAARLADARRALAGAGLLLLLGVLSAATWRQQGIWRDSASLWRYETTLYPDQNAMAYFNLGQAYKDLGQNEQAAQALATAMALRPNDPEAVNALGVAEARMGRLAEAAKHFETALAMSPTHAEALSNLGAAYLGLGRAREATILFEKSVKANPALADAHFNLGLACWQEGRAQDALAEYRKAVELRPDYAAAHNNMGQVYMSLGRPAEAAAEYRAILELAPDDLVARHNLGAAERARRAAP